MKIWVDIATSPQVLFLRPIIAELKDRGHEVFITTRDSTETLLLADRYGFSHTPIGAHGGHTMTGKAAAILWRAVRMAGIVKREGKVSLALSHSSYSQALVAGWLRIPMVACGDYEGNPANHITCRIARKLLVPDVFDKSNLYKYGASPRKVEAYRGLKENIYLSDFAPDPAFLQSACIPRDKIIVTMRPPNLVASYHRFDNPLFDQILDFVLGHPDTFVVLVPRGNEQRQKYGSIEARNLLIPNGVLDGPDLIYHSDLVVGAGGTMNREASVLGTPVYTVFKGMLGSVDRHLINTGKMVRIVDVDDISKIRLCKKDRLPDFVDGQGHEIVSELVDRILDTKTSSPSIEK